MSAQAPPLVEILATLTAVPDQRSKPLERGLILAYTPGSLNETEPGVFRLTVSRHGVWPSNEEVVIVKRDLWKALIQNGRLPERISVEPWLRGKRDVHYHVLFWREGRQERLL